MKINSLRAGILSALISLSSAGCKKAANYRILSQEFVPHKTILNLDSIRKEGTKVLSDSQYVFLGHDTVELNKDFAVKPQSFIESLNKRLEKIFDKKICVKEELEVYLDQDGAYLTPLRDYVPKYIDKKTIIKSDKIFTTDSIDMFVPVEYYGKINPEVKNFLNK